MVDLIQLTSIQPIAKELELAGENDPIDGSNSLQDGTAFIAILEHLLLDEVNESLVIGQEKNLKQQEETSVEFSEQMELNNSAEFCENNYNNQEIDDEISTGQKEELDLLIADNPQLAWFNASSFEAPGVNLEPPQEEISPSVNHVVPNNKKTLAALTNVENKKQEINEPSTVVLEEANEATEQSMAVKLDRTSKQDLPLVKSMSDYSIDETPLKTLVEQTKNSEGNISSITAEKDLPQLNSKDNGLLVVESSDKNVAAMVPAVANHLTSTQTAVAIPVKMIELPQSVISPEWGSEFNQQIIWLGQQKIKSATIKLNPQELGPLEVNIKVVKEVATVNITTHSIPVRDLIEQALPRLREMMAEQGVNLSQVNIESNSNHRQQSQQNDEKKVAEWEINDEQVLATTPLTGRINKGLIDYFA